MANGRIRSRQQGYFACVFASLNRPAFLSRGAPLLSPSTGRDWNRNEITEATLIDATVLKAVLECKCVPAPRHPNVLLLGGDLVFWS
jgi:hypothetical protein